MSATDDRTSSVAKWLDDDPLEKHLTEQYGSPEELEHVDDPTHWRFLRDSDDDWRFEKIARAEAHDGDE